jgi:Domain of unknown function DUF11
MYRGIGLLAGMLAAAALALPSAASADTTLGLTTQPSGSTPTNCPTGLPPAGVLIGQAASDPSTPYAVASSATDLLSWSVNTTGDSAGTITLWVIAPAAGGGYTLVTTDTETLPSPLPASNIATFTPGAPIPLAPGDTFALSGTGTTFNCYWTGGSTPVGDALFAAPQPVPPTPGTSVTPLVPGSGPGFTLNLAATLRSPSQDAGVTAASSPAAVTGGGQALLADTVTNNGPGTQPITVTDVVPAGLTIDAAAAGNGTCTTAGQTVTCTITGLAAGTSAPVYVVVTSGAAGSYANTATVAPAQTGVTDPNAANNTASATLTVTAPPATTKPACVVLSFKGVPQRVAKKLLPALHCSVGKVKRASSRSVAKGDVIATNPRAGSYAAGQRVGLKVSSGKPNPKHKVRKHHHKPTHQPKR